jgi:glycosyltransferase involved in cell wall biosynthesis
VSDVGVLLMAVDVVINVNRFSLFDLSTIEALEAGRPLLLTPVGGNLAFEGLGAGAVMLDAVEPAAIAAGLRAVFDMAPAARAALGARSRACYETHLTPRHLRQRHVDLYDAAAATTGARA